MSGVFVERWKPIRPLRYSSELSWSTPVTDFKLEERYSLADDYI